MNTAEATHSYERWVQRDIDIVPADLERKHRMIAADAYAFFRGTHYRWAQRWQAMDATLRRAPRVLAVADLHVENFGTWRDLEGRLMWGVNDFDEAFPLPYTYDLTRLAAAVAVARKTTDLEVGLSDATQAILAGYRSCLQHGQQPFVIENQQRWLREIALDEVKDPAKFWCKLETEGERCDNPPDTVRRLLRRELPDGAETLVVVRRVAGMGTLGMPRYVALADWAGSPIAREAKRLPPPSLHWALHHRSTSPRRYSRLLAALHPHPDPCYRPIGGWVVKRLGPDCAKVKLAHLEDDSARLRLLEAMGYETANVHVASVSSARLTADLESRPEGWLKDAAKAMTHGLFEDFNAWRAIGK
jgi:hypothetical protein